MCESPRLPSGSIDGDGAIAKSLLHESRDYHPVPPGLARTHRIEKPDNTDRQIPAPMIGQGGELIDELRSGITPA